MAHRADGGFDMRRDGRRVFESVSVNQHTQFMGLDDMPRPFIPRRGVLGFVQRMVQAFVGWC